MNEDARNHECEEHNLAFFIVTFVAGDVLRILIFASFGTLFFDTFLLKARNTIEGFYAGRRYYLDLQVYC
jgi:hypothetical protein